MGKVSCCVALLGVLGAALVSLTLSIWPQRVSVCPSCSPLTLKPSVGDYCKADTTGFEITDVDKRGYAIFRDFISADEKAELMAIFDELEPDTVKNPGGNAGNNVGYRQPSWNNIDLFEKVPSLRTKIEKIARSAAKDTRINIFNHNDKYGEHPIFFTTNASEPTTLKFGWHQDAENYFYFQDLMNFLDFYIMLQKPDPNAAGLGLVPWDLLQDRCPELFELVRGDRSDVESWGASAFMPGEGSGMIVMDMVHDRSRKMDFNLDDVACFPELREGDLLLFRGDTIHRTQEHNSYRTSLNVLTYQKHKRFPYSDKLFEGGLAKYTFMYNSAGIYLYFLHMAGVYRGREQWVMPLMARVNEVRLYGGYYLRLSLAPLRYALDIVLDASGRAG